MIYIYSNNNSKRLQYTLDVIFKTILQVDFKWVAKEAFVAETKAPKINYSDEELSASIWIKPHELLFEKNIHPQNIQVTHKKEIPYFFKTAKSGLFQFDLFASSFYMLSRYEEYLPFIADEHGRFTAQESLACKTNFLHLPVVHWWARLLRDLILKKHPEFLFPTSVFTQANTIDVDIAYAYKGKPFKRRLGGFIRSFLSFNFQDIKNRVAYSFGVKDPYDTYDLLAKIHAKSNAENTYFFQVGAHGVHDKNLPLNKVMQKLITRIATYASIGIHPSYESNTSIETLQKEFQDLSELLGKSVTKSRQHYLKMRLPETYENLISIGVQEDYTMGFPDIIGFRAGMAMPFPFFNLQTNKQRPFMIVPFQLMDGTLKDYMKLAPEEAILKVQELKKAIREVNGQFVSIFHNSSLTDQGEWKGWLAVFKEVLN